MLCLPAPTGPRPVGVTTLHLRDASRPDPWVPTEVRELMVSLWYPAARGHGEPAAYLTATESELLLRPTGLRPDALSTTRTNAHTDAEPAGDGLPLVVLSPGFTKPRKVLTALAEDLASHGFAVAAIDHTYENVATTFPDGRVTTCLAGHGVPHDRAFWLKLKWGRATDVSFVLDELTKRPLVDATRIAMAGHSVGGGSAIPALLSDFRLQAGVDIDGGTDVDIPGEGLDRPFLFLGRQSQYDPATGSPAAAGWQRDWERLTGWKRRLVVAGAVHHSFTDLGVLADQLGVALSAELSGARCLEITRACVRAFAELHLCDRPQSLPVYPEVAVLD